jgi:hypothetical protein
MGQFNRCRESGSLSEEGKVGRMAASERLSIDDLRLCTDLGVSDAFIKVDDVAPAGVLDGVGALGYLSVGIPAAYVLKKLSDEALGRFAKWLIDKIVSRASQGRYTLVTIYVREEGKPRPSPVLIVEYPVNAEADDFATALASVVQWTLEASGCDLAPVSVRLGWDSRERAWTLRGGSLRVQGRNQ